MVYYNIKKIRENKKKYIILSFIAIFAVIFYVKYPELFEFEKDSRYESCNNYSYFYVEAENQLRRNDPVKIYNMNCSFNGIYKNNDKDGIITVKCKYEHRNISGDVTKYERNVDFNCSLK